MDQETLLKYISYLELWPNLCSAEQNHLCNFGRMHHEELFCEIILNFDKLFKDIFRSGTLALAGLLFGGADLFVQF